MAYPELTGSHLQDRVARAMGWLRPGDWPAAHQAIEVFNEVGEWLTNGHPWNHLTRDCADINIVTGQQYADLPVDYARYIDIGPGVSPSGLTIRMSDMNAVRRARSQQATSGSTTSFVGAIPHSAPTLAGPQSKPILALGPIPQQTVSKAFLLTYGAGWVALVTLNDHVLLPSWLIGPYVRACCEYMGGYEKSKLGTVEDRMDRLWKSSLFQNAIDRDDTLQTDLGEVRNGAESQITGGDDGAEYWHADRSNQPNIIVGS